MQPGQDCLRCHGPNRSLTWAAAGTVFGGPSASADSGVQGVLVRLTDSTGRTIELTTNGAGNFYTAESLAFPLSATVSLGGQSVSMITPVPKGSCNSCHTQPPQNSAPGRLHTP